MEKIAGVFGKPLKNKGNDLPGDDDDDDEDEDVSFHGYKEFYTKKGAWVAVLLDTHLLGPYKGQIFRTRYLILGS